MNPTAFVLNLHMDEGIDVTKHWDCLHLFDAMADVGVDVYQGPSWPFPRPPACVVIAGQHHTSADDVRRIQAAVTYYGLGDLSKRLPVIVTSDEGSVFPWSEVHNSNVQWWISTPRKGPHGTMPEGTRFFGEGPGPVPANGWPSSTNRPIDLSFRGQATHPRRHECVQALRDLRLTRKDLRVEVTATDGFMQGGPRDAYLTDLALSKIVCCPSGPVTADSFRLYEAIECGALPIIERRSGDGQDHGVWDLMYPHGDRRIPCPIIGDWRDVHHIVDEYANDPARLAAKVDQCQLWWQERKADLRDWLRVDLGLSA